MVILLSHIFNQLYHLEKYPGMAQIVNIFIFFKDKFSSNWWNLIQITYCNNAKSWNRQLFDVDNIYFSFWWMCSSKVSIIISFKSDSAILTCVYCWSDIDVILSSDSLGIAYQEKKQLQDQTIITHKLRQMEAQKTKFISNRKPGWTQICV